MKIWIGAFSLLAFGLFLTWSGYRSIRHELHIHGLPWIEGKILDVTGEEPLPKSQLDRLLGGINHWLSVIFGPIFAALGVLIIASETGLT